LRVTHSFDTGLGERVVREKVDLPGRDSIGRDFTSVSEIGADTPRESSFSPHVPELPDITVYIEAIRARVIGQPLREIRLETPFLLRTIEPRLDEMVGKHVIAVERLGKRIVFELEDDLFIVLHLMIAGRLHWKPSSSKKGKKGLAAFEFPNGTLTLTEAGTKRRASLHLARGRALLAEFSRGGLEVLDASRDQFAERLRSESHTVKRSLTDPRLFSGIGNAYSDEILHRAKLSPVKLTGRLTDDEIAKLYDATQDTLVEWTDRLRAEAAGDFPEKVTAFRDEMAVHGKFGQPCPVCGTPVQRIRYADNETNYCARCQTDGKLLADRGLSRLLKQDWPRSIDEVI
jgi:formamidopyrimidine-DNA glycosylase